MHTIWLYVCLPRELNLSNSVADQRLCQHLNVLYELPSGYNVILWQQSQPSFTDVYVLMESPKELVSKQPCVMGTLVEICLVFSW